MGIQVLRRRPGVGAGFALIISGLFTGLVQAQQATNELGVLDDLALPAEPRLRPSNVTVTADFLTGLGNITLPVGYALDGDGIGRSVQSPDRESIYYGASISWQAFASLGFDLSFSQGTSSGDFTFKPEASGRWPQGTINSSFTLDDTWLQGYVRYKINRFSGTRLGAYLRGGVTYMDAEYEGRSNEGQAFYRNTGTIRDITGNLGFGLDYRLFNFKENRIRTRAVLEGEGFGGIRSREFNEVTIPFSGENSMDNMVYGGLGRLLLRAEYSFGNDQQWRAFIEGGIQLRWTMESYKTPDRALVGDNGVDLSNVEIRPSGNSDLLWGPYVRLGLRYAF